MKFYQGFVHPVETMLLPDQAGYDPWGFWVKLTGLIPWGCYGIW